MIFRALILFLLSTTAFAGTEGPRFRLHLLGEPNTLSPYMQKTSANTYLITQMGCPLLTWEDGVAKPRGAVCKTKGKTRVVCEIDARLRFDDGTSVTAEHYRQSFMAFVNPEHPSPRAEILAPIKNVSAILGGKKKLEDIGIKASGKKLTFELERPDPDFPLTLANPLLTAVVDTKIPLPADYKRFRSCGAYQFESWENGRKITLKPNPHAFWAHPNRPRIEFVYFAEDAIALQAYEKNDLDYLRRLPTLYLGKWEASKELHKIDQIRFDYLGFAKVRTPDELRLAKALNQSIDFEAWRQLYSAKPRPGCFGLPESWTGDPVCWDFDVKKAKEVLAAKTTKPIRLVYSKQGGDDHDRTMQFLQSQWKRHLGLDVSIESQENKMFIENLGREKIGFFRKGLSPERPSCLAVLTTFSKGHPENYIRFENAEFEKVLRDLVTAKPKDQAKLCRRGVELLRDQAGLMPTGPVYFSILVKPGWAGWSLNDLNQLDLSGLHREP